MGGAFGGRLCGLHFLFGSIILLQCLISWAFQSGENCLHSHKISWNQIEPKISVFLNMPFTVSSLVSWPMLFSNSVIKKLLSEQRPRVVIHPSWGRVWCPLHHSCVLLLVPWVLFHSDNLLFSFFFFFFFCYSITVVCLFSPSLHPTPDFEYFFSAPSCLQGFFWEVSWQSYGNSFVGNCLLFSYCF